MADDIDLNIDKTVDDFINDVAPGSEPAPAEDKVAPAAPAVTSLAKPATGALDPIEYPKSWKQDFAGEWPKIPRPLQEYITGTREKDYLNGLEQYKSGHTAYAEIHEVLTPYMARINSLGIRPAEAIQSLMNADWALANGSPEQKLNMLAQICATYGIDPSGIKPSGDQPFRTEAELALAKKFDGMESNFKAFVGQHLAGQRAEIDKNVAAFAADPAHPHFNECGDHIARLLSADRTLSLQDAYDQAVWANPTTREKEIVRVSKEKEDKARLEREEAAKTAARARTANLRGKPTEKGTGAAKGGWEDELPVTAAKIANR